jgi:pilus assembly protein CpaE
MAPLTAAFVISNRTVWDQAYSCIQNLPVRLAVEQGVSQNDPAETEALLDRIERHRVDVVLVEAGRIALPLEEFVRRIRTAAAQPAVFVLSLEASPELILEALRAGANEYLYPPLADTLRDALQKLAAARSKNGSHASGGLGKIFGFLSARGGCGATTFAVHVAADIARQTKAPMLLADCDFDAGLLRFLMKSKSAYSVRDALDNLHRMDASLWKALVSSPAPNLDLIAAPEEIAAKRHPGREEMTHLMRFIRSTYPLSIIDFGRSVSMAALDSLPELEAIYLLTTPDFMSLESASRAIQMIEERGFLRHRIYALLNKSKPRETPDLAGFAATLRHSCHAVFRNDHMSLYDAYSEGRFLPVTSALGKELHALAESIRTDAAGEPGPDKKAPSGAPAGSKRWFSFLHKAVAFEETREQEARA